MPRTKVCCLKGLIDRDILIKEAENYGLDVVIQYPKITPNIFDIITQPSQNTQLNNFLETIENNPNVYIFYDITHKKCLKKFFRVNVATNEEERKLSYISNVPEEIIPPKMRSYYLFPDTIPSEDLRPKIGVISLGGYYNPLDFPSYWDRCGFTSVRPLITDRPVDGNIIPVFTPDINSLENTLDIELIGGFCQSANIFFYSATNTDTGYLGAFQAAIDDQMDIVSTSWGQSEENFYGIPQVLLPIFDAVFRRAVTGQVFNPISNTYEQISNHYTIITAASGDYGSADNNYDEVKNLKVPVPHADFPASSPWVVACGGTSLYLDLDLDPLIRNQESAWIYGGGGQSSQFIRPDYQEKNLAWKDVWPISPIAYGSPNNPFQHTDPNTKPRTLPDVVFNADPNSPWLIIFDQYDDEGAGTSAVAPIMAALLGELYIASKPEAAPRNNYFGDGFNTNLYRAPSASVKRIFYGYNVTVDRDPITKAPNPYGLIDKESNTYYFIWEDDTAYTFCCGKGVVLGQQIIKYLNTVVCVVYGTQILMEDGRYKPIEQITRGDYVIGYEGRKYQVADINKQFVSKHSTIDLIEFPPNSLGDGLPINTLLITPNHPIFYKGARRPAKSFKKLPNIIEHSGVKPTSLIKPESYDELGPIYYLYDLQFDDDGSYIAEGITIQSRSTWSDITPLAKELYFDQSRYRDETHWDGFNHVIPLDEQELLP